MLVDEINPLQDQSWNQFVLSHYASSAFHCPGWIDALRKTYGFRPAALVYLDARQNICAGLVYCYVDKLFGQPRIISLPFSDHCAILAHSQDTQRELSESLAQFSGDCRCGSIELRPVGTHPCTPPYYPSQAFYFHRLDLRPGSSRILQGAHKDSIQRRIRRAEHSDLRIESGRSHHIVEQFYPLMVRTRRRHGLPVQPLCWFENLSDCIKDQLSIHLAFQGDRAIAGVLMLEHRTVITYKYGASDERCHNLGAMPYLFWHVIQDAAARGFEELDMGRTDIDNAGLATFKEHWGAKRTESTYWSFPAPHTSPFRIWAQRLAQRALRHSPEYVVTSLGSLLYRYCA